MPGPFHIGSVTNSRGLEICNEAYLTVGSETGEEEDDCEIRIHGAHAHEIARLIAAAPEMLDYCKLMAANGDPDAIDLVAKATQSQTSAMRESK